MSSAPRSHVLPLFWILAALAGCSTAHGPAEEISSGAYALTIGSLSDHCSPERISGEIGEAAVVRAGGVLSVVVPGPAPADVQHLTLLEAEGFHRESVGGMEECSTARTHRRWTVVEQTADSFVLERVERFEGLSTCGPMEDAPEADCEAVSELRFRLLSECAAPCEVTWSPAAGVACACS